MRTFRFMVAGAGSADEQQQTISCNLHLEPAADVATTQPTDCSCYTDADCNPRLYCLEIRSEGNHGDDLLLFRNDQG